jgi:ankyrin repeat protein
MRIFFAPLTFILALVCVSCRPTPRQDCFITDAIADSNEAQLKKLLADGCDPNVPGSALTKGNQMLPPTLIQAIESNQLKLVMALVGAGANVNTVGSQRFTPLHASAYYGRPDITRYLLEHGANQKAQDVLGRTPFDVALWQHQMGTAQVMTNWTKSHATKK